MLPGRPAASRLENVGPVGEGASSDGIDFPALSGVSCDEESHCVSGDVPHV